MWKPRTFTNASGTLNRRFVETLIAIQGAVATRSKANLVIHKLTKLNLTKPNGTLHDKCDAVKKY